MPPEYRCTWVTHNGLALAPADGARDPAIAAIITAANSTRDTRMSHSFLAPRRRPSSDRLGAIAHWRDRLVPPSAILLPDIETCRPSLWNAALRGGRDVQARPQEIAHRSLQISPSL